MTDTLHTHGWTPTYAGLPCPPGEQSDILMYSRHWATWLKGMVTVWSEEPTEWAVYNQQTDRYEKLDEIPEFWMVPLVPGSATEPTLERFSGPVSREDFNVLRRTIGELRQSADEIMMAGEPGFRIKTLENARALAHAMLEGASGVSLRYRCYLADDRQYAHRRMTELGIP